MERKNAWDKYPQESRNALMEFGEKYRQLDRKSVV